MDRGVWLILPTYNEAENIAAIVRAVQKNLKLEVGDDYCVLIVDDNSPDGTGQIAASLAESCVDVEVIHRASKTGLGQAYVTGFRHALAHGAEYIFEMDADFSHDPTYLKHLLARVRDGVDLALGSRYVAGGSIVNWGITRRVISRLGCLYARLILRVPVRDLTGGFKCFRADALRTIDYETTRSEGYAFQVELTYRALKRGLRVEELPITFSERQRGKSKMSSRVALEAAWMVPALRWADRSSRTR